MSTMSYKCRKKINTVNLTERNNFGLTLVGIQLNRYWPVN